MRGVPGARLRAWYRGHARDLPWRRTKDPYRIWVSEIMLQQTQVATVLPYYASFIKRFPDVGSLSLAPEREVLRFWAGLGYYSRARNLHRAAREIAARGGFPRTFEGLRALPGVGRYTAGAVGSIAFGLPVPAVDGNVIRVLSRIFAIGGDLSSASGHRKVWELAGRLVDPAAPGEWNQALMELGATVCLPAAPRCSSCPIASSCRARKAGRVDRYPGLGPGRKSVAVRLATAVAVRNGRTLIEERPASSRFLGGHSGPPTVEVAGGSGRQALRAAFGSALRLGAKAGTVKHSITRHRITLEVYRASAVRVRRPLRWVRTRDLDRVLVSSLFRKALEAAC